MSVRYEEAARCPKCDNTGELVQEREGPDGSRIHVLRCQNPPCRWFGTDWVVQKLSDGTVPVRDEQERRPKTFPKLHLPRGVQEYIDGIKDESLPPDPTSRRE